MMRWECGHCHTVIEVGMPGSLALLTLARSEFRNQVGDHQCPMSASAVKTPPPDPCPVEGHYA